jgi:hypothetical protein
MGKKQNEYILFMGKLNGKRPMGRPRYIWKDNIKIDLKETGWNGMDWIHLVQDMDQWWALVNMAINLQVP